MKNKKVTKSKGVFKGLLFNLLIAYTLAIFAISMIVSTIGYYRFSNYITEMYEDAAYNTARTGVVLVNGDKIDQYIEENEGKTEDFTAEYAQVLNYLTVLCDTQKVSMVFVIKLTDEYSEGGAGSGDYTTYYSVFDVLTKEPILPSYFKPWAVGTVNDKTQQVKVKDREMYAQIWNGTLDKGSMVQLQEKGSDMFDHITTLMPIKNSAGEVTAIMCIQQPMEKLEQARESYMTIIGIVTVGLAIFFVIISWLYLRIEITKPLNAVAGEAERFAKNTLKPDKPLKKIIRSRISEISTLVQSLDDMESDTLAYIENLGTMMAEKQKMGAELEVAKQIQENSVPNKFPAFPDIKEFDLFASMTPAKQVGGDFYDYCLIDDDHLLLAIADVSGKGVPAALFMMVTMILINERAMMGGNTEDIVKFVNERICSHNEAEMFVTMWVGILEISTGKITAVNAGHDDPVIYRNGKTFEIDKQKHGLVIGAMSGTKYTPYEIQLQKGDKLFIYTDGVPEATRSDNCMFTLNGMVKSLNKHATSSPEGIINGIKEDVNAFIGDAVQFDDMTMLCLEYKGEGDVKSITLEAKDSNLSKVNKFIEEIISPLNCTKKTVQQLEIAIEEIYTNIAHYAYEGEAGDVQVEAVLDGKKLCVTFVDEGKEYNPLNREDPNIRLSAEDREIGGLGIFMTKKIMDKIHYERLNNQNILKLEKKL